MTIHQHPIAISLAAMLIAAACVVPPATQGNTAPPAGGGGGGEAHAEGGSGGAYTCADYCGHLGECQILDQYGIAVEECSAQCEANWSDASQGTIDQVTSSDCATLQAYDAGDGGGGGGDGGGYNGGGYGGGGSGQGCVASHASQPVQDCPSGQECCDSRCWTQGMCSMPTGK